MDNSNLFGEILETGKTAAKKIVKTAAKLPVDIASTAAEQISGQSGGSNQQNSAFQQQINQLKQQDAQDVEVQMDAIRRNLANLMTPPAPSNNELPKYMKGVAGSANTVQELEKLNEEAKKKQDEMEDLPTNIRGRVGSNEGQRGASG